MHYLSGFVPHAVLVYWTDVATWVSLFVLVTSACLFELVENSPGAGKIMWTWLGYTLENYHIDALCNSVSDVLFLLLGWLTVQLTHMLSSSHTAFWILLGVAGFLFALFMWLFTRERAQWRVDKAKTSAVAPVGTAASVQTRATALRNLPSVPSIVGGGGGGATGARESAPSKPRVAFVL